MPIRKISLSTFTLITEANELHLVAFSEINELSASCSTLAVANKVLI